MFTQSPTIQTLQLSNGQAVYVIDDFCLDPDALVQLGSKNLAQFRLASDEKKVGYPGIEWIVPLDVHRQLVEFFMLHIRRFTQSRREIYSVSRLSMVTFLPEQLHPAQSICHCDVARYAGGQMTASVLYLFDDETLGGTSFYQPRKSPKETQKIVHDSIAMQGEQFFNFYGIERSYLLDSNEWFEKIGTVPAKKNRIAFYSGDIFHSADITHPHKLTANPLNGRISLNGFFYFKPNAQG
jgi:Family of unknown function (DUF6445)